MRTLSRRLTWLVCAALLLGLFPVHAAQESGSFRFEDVADESAYYFTPVYWAYGHEPQITNGVNPCRFMPDDPCTRGQVVTFLWRAAGKPAPNSDDNPFMDVGEDQYYSDAVRWAVEQDLTRGTASTRFSPDLACSRAQIVTFLWRNAGMPAPENGKTVFTDVDEDEYYGKAVAWALEQGVTTGASKTLFRPDDTCTRGQIVTFLYRAAQLPDEPVHEHVYEAVITAPTCTQAGFTTCTCVCGDSYVIDETAALGHDYAAEVTPPTCTQKGSTTYTCTRCGDTQSGGETDALGHDYSAEVTPPTCTEGGHTVFSCTRCGDSYAGDETDALGHDWGEGEITKQPSESEPGVRTFTCSRCGETRTEAIPVLPHTHSYTAVVTAPTCTEKGFTTHTCACGERYTDSEIPALGHDYGTAVTAPTCIEGGYTTCTCARCGDSYRADAVPALGHSFGEWTETKAASCTLEGVQTRACIRCGATEARSIEAQGHDYRPVLTAPTCTEPGYTTYTCARCNDSYTGDGVAALGHDYQDGVCARCGEADPDFGKTVGYLSATSFGDGFVACGTGGRIDYISASGEVRRLDSGTAEELRCVYAAYPSIMACGARGTVVVSNDAGETFSALNLPASANLRGCVEYKGTIYCAGSGGSVYRHTAAGWRKTQMPTRNEIISLIVTRKYLVAVTAETDVCFSADGLSWDHMNFNEDYEGLYPPYVFTRAVGAGETFFVLGYDAQTPNLPLIMYTDTGEVWMQKPIGIINGEYITGEEDLQIHDICFNTDQIVGMLNDGRILAITDCFKCNELLQLDAHNDLLATAIREEGVLVCGEGFFSRVISRRQIRQDKIGEEQAWYDVQRGALLIDVRSASERAGGYIKGSIHIPVGEVAARLPELTDDPYQEIIFYCASGARAQRATEQAVEMGYEKVYNLGGLSNLTEGYFEIVKE